MISVEELTCVRNDLSFSDKQYILKSRIFKLPLKNLIETLVHGCLIFKFDTKRPKIFQNRTNFE